mmetsp:Transcript_40835/g.79956  ORF Transcript_40835/g.79956 Transcript_40835/m.79956 type:complete len:128 (-) Transcript_40835:70-453(-)
MWGKELLQAVIMDVASPHRLHETRPVLLLLILFVGGFVVGLAGFMVLVMSVRAAERYTVAASKVASGVTKRLQRRFSGASGDPEGSPHTGRPSTLRNLIHQCPSPATKFGGVPFLPRQGSKLIAAIM